MSKLSSKKSNKENIVSILRENGISNMDIVLENYIKNPGMSKRIIECFGKISLVLDNQMEFSFVKVFKFEKQDVYLKFTGINSVFNGVILDFDDYGVEVKPETKPVVVYK